MLKRLITSFFCWLLLNTSHAQIRFYAEGEELNYANAGIQYAFIEGNEFTDSLMRQIPSARWRSLRTSRLSVGFKSESIWLKIPISAISSYGNFEILEIKNPHINFFHEMMKINKIEKFTFLDF